MSERSFRTNESYEAEAINTLTLQAAAKDPAAAQEIITAAALPKQPPDTRSPTDLQMLMARAMDSSLKQRGLTPPSDINSIYSAQDAANFIRQANAVASGAE